MNKNSSNDDRIKRANEFVQNIFSVEVGYHNHKELMAHAALLLQIAIFGAIILAHPWPPSWIPLSQEWFAAIFTILWISIYVYLRWQLHQRRASAHLSAAARVVLTRWLNQPPPKKDTQPGKKNSQHKCKLITWVVDCSLFPCKSGGLPTEKEKPLYPQALVTEWVNQVKKGISPIWIEGLITGGSLFMFLLIILRIFSVINLDVNC